MFVVVELQLGGAPRKRTVTNTNRVGAVGSGTTVSTGVVVVCVLAHLGLHNEFLHTPCAHTARDVVVERLGDGHERPAQLAEQCQRREHSRRLEHIAARRVGRKTS